jgi:hypothetical protein
MVSILLLAGRRFSGSNLTKKILGGWAASFGCFAGVFEGVLEIRVFFDGNLLVDLW